MVPLLLATAVAVGGAGLMSGSLAAGVLPGAIFSAFVGVPVYGLVDFMADRSPGGQGPPPGPVLVAFIAAAAAMLVLSASAPWDGLLWFVFGFLLWATAGTVWLVRLGTSVVRGGPRSLRPHLLRWLVPPVIGIGGLVLAVSGAPFLIRFELSKPALDEAARQSVAGRLEPGAPVSLGLFQGMVEANTDGSVGFYLGSTGNDAISLEQLADGARPANDEFTVWQHMDGRWWLLTVVTSR